VSENRLKTKKLLRLFLGATSGSFCRVSPTEQFDCNSIHAPGVGYSNPLLRLDFSGYWLSRLCRATEPRARYLTCCATTYIQQSAPLAPFIIRYRRHAVKDSSRLNLHDPPLALSFAQHDDRALDSIGHRDLSALISKTPVVQIKSALLD
jgi:hypothetical protein